MVMTYEEQLLYLLSDMEHVNTSSKVLCAWINPDDERFLDYVRGYFDDITVAQDFASYQSNRKKSLGLKYITYINGHIYMCDKNFYEKI